MNMEERAEIRAEAERVTEIKANAIRGATIIMMAEMLRLLAERNLISTTDISAFATKLETLAATTMATTPDIGAALAESALMLRHAFEDSSATRFKT